MKRFLKATTITAAIGYAAAASAASSSSASSLRGSVGGGNVKNRDLQVNESPTYHYGFNMSGPEAIVDTFPGGSAATFLNPDSVTGITMSLARLTLTPGGVRELHWHPAATEWGFVTEGTCRVNLLDNDGNYDNVNVGVGGIWAFPKSWGHSIVGADPEVGCTMILFFNNKELPTYNDLSISEIVSFFPNEILEENLNTPPDVLNEMYKKGAIVVNQGEFPIPPLYESISPLPKSGVYKNIYDAPCFDAGSGGYIFEVRGDTFPLSNFGGMSGGLQKLQAGALRDIHWHPNADEMHYVLKGKLQVMVYGVGGASDVYHLDAGDVGFVPKGFVHAFKAIDEETDVLLAFNNGDWQTQELSTWLGATPDYLIAASLNTTLDAVANFPKATSDFQGGNSFGGCPLAPETHKCFGPGC